MATIHVWTGNAGDFNWDSPDNWNPNNPSYADPLEHFVIDASSPNVATTINLLDFGFDESFGAIILDNSNYVLSTTVGVDNAGGLVTLDLAAHLTVTNGVLHMAGFRINAGTAADADLSDVSVGSGGTITLETYQGAASTLHAAETITNNGLISGYGFLDGNLEGSGAVTATGGILKFTGSLLGTNTLNIAAVSAFELMTATTLGSSTANFTGAGVLAIDTASTFAGGAVTGMTVGVGAGTETTVIDFNGKDVQDASYDDGTDTLTVNFVGGGSATFTTNNVGAAFANWNTASDRVFLTDTVCYAQGTHIATDRGDVAIENLSPGDHVIVMDGDTRRSVPVKWIGIRHVALSGHPSLEMIAPVRIARDAFATNVPCRDLIVSPPHAIYVGGKLIPARLLVNGMTVTRCYDMPEVTYYHVELDRHSILFAEGLPAESYLDTGNRSFFRNASVTDFGAAKYHVDLSAAIWEEQACAPLAVAPDDVRPHWDRLAGRAIELGYSEPKHAVTSNPDLHVMVGDRRISAMEVVGNTYRFVVPGVAETISLVSRSVVPAHLAGWKNDARRLGVAIRALSFVTDAGVDVIAADHPALSTGWHAAEVQGTSAWRWTDGNAVIPVPPRGTAILEVQVAVTTTYILEPGQERRLAA